MKGRLKTLMYGGRGGGAVMYRWDCDVKRG